MPIQIRIIMFALILILPLTGLEAKDSDDDRKDKDRHEDRDEKRFKPFKSKRFLQIFSQFATKEDLDSLNLAIADINSRVASLELQVGGLPAELAAALAELRVDIDDNSSDVSLALSDIEDILIDIQGLIRDLSANGSQLDNLEMAVAGLVADLAALETVVGGFESRITALETSSPPPELDVTFSGDFTGVDAPGGGEAPNAAILQAWDAFTSSATGSFSSIEIRNSFDGGASYFASAICSDSTKTEILANVLNTFDPTSPTTTSLACGGLTWNIGISGGGMELNAGTSALVSNCNFQGIAIRPFINNQNWGGVGSDFGGPINGTCGAQSQTFEVILTR